MRGSDRGEGGGTDEDGRASAPAAALPVSLSVSVSDFDSGFVCEPSSLNHRSNDDVDEVDEVDGFEWGATEAGFSFVKTGWAVQAYLATGENLMTEASGMAANS